MSFLGSAAGAVASGIIKAVGGIWANKQNSAQAALDRDFQREVLQNRNQWQAEDLKKAGINPILTAGSPSGATGSNASIAMQNPLSGLADGLTSAMNLDLQERQLKKDLKVADSVISKNYADAFYADEQSDYLSEQTEGAKIANDKSLLDYQYFKDTLPTMLSKLKQEYANTAKDYEVKQSTIDANRAAAGQSHAAAHYYSEQERKLRLDNDLTETFGDTGKLWRSISDDVFGSENTTRFGHIWNGLSNSKPEDVINGLVGFMPESFQRDYYSANPSYSPY